MLLASELNVLDPHYFKGHKMILYRTFDHQFCQAGEDSVSVVMNQINEAPMLRNKTAAPVVT